MIISIDAERACDKIQGQFMIKNSQQNLIIEGMYLNIIKTICDQMHSYFHTQWAKATSISLKIRNKTRYLLSQLLFNMVLEVLATAIRQEEEIKGI